MSFSAELAQITPQRFLVVPVIVPGPARNIVTKSTKVGASEGSSSKQPASGNQASQQVISTVSWRFLYDLKEEQATKSFAPLIVGVARCKAERAFFPARKPNF